MIQSVQRAGSLLKAFGSDSPEQGVSELSRRVGLHKSTVSRLLATLEQSGLVERVPGSDKYRLGFEIARLAGQVSHFGDLRGAARPALLALVEATRETVHLAVRDGGEVINIEQLAGPHLMREANWVGRRTALHCVANGKALLAYAPPDLIERILAGRLAAHTPQTITEPETLRAELAMARERGYATAVGEIEAGLNAVAAAVRDQSGFAIAAVSISGPAYRVTPERLSELGTLVASAAATIEARM